MASEKFVARATLEFALTDRLALLAACEGVQALLGFSAVDMLSGKLAFRDLIHADDEDVGAALFDAAATTPLTEFNLRLRHADGRIRCVKGRAEKSVVAGEGRLRIVLEDARALAVGEQNMLANFRAMMENTDDFIFFKDRNHVFTGASQTLVAITAPSEHWTDLIGKTDYDVFPQAYADAYYRLEKEVFAGRAVAHAVQEIVGKNGVKGWVDNRKYPIRDEAGRIIGLFGIARDISAMKRTEETQHEALATLQKISSRVPGVVFQYRLRADGSFCFPYASEALHELFGLRPEDVREDAAEMLAMVHADDDTRLRLSIAKSARDLTPWQEDFRVRQSDGRARWISSNALPEREADGGVLWYGFMTDVSERKQLEEQVRQMAFVDVLTDLPNRRLLGDRLAQAMAASARNASYGAVLFIDLDNFKPLNDAYGHAVGDLLLVVVAERLKRCVRGMDTVARFGGDEFVVMIAELGGERDEAATQACLIGEKIRSAVSEPYLLTIRAEGKADSQIDYRCTASVGIRLFTGSEISAEDILRAADQAMYRAKEAGRNAVELAAEPQRGRPPMGNLTPGFVQLTWHPDYDCGNALIDAQHRALFAAANRLLAAVLAARPADEVGKLIDGLLTDVIHHFADEEAIIATTAFAGAAEHAALHRELAAGAAALGGEFRAGTLDSGALLHFVVEEVIARHMLKADREWFAALDSAASEAIDADGRR